jgi:hypothetical protein
MEFQFQVEGNILAFVAKSYIPNNEGLPIASVRLAKVMMHNGVYERTFPLSPNDQQWRAPLLKNRFKLYRGPKRLGIFTYEAVPDEKKINKNEDYLRAIPIDKDALIQTLTVNTREQADILNLLNMTIEESAAAAKNESRLNEILAKAEADEIALLQKGKLKDAALIFVPLNMRK